ncbi:hypothetical protein [Streptomyces smyrnaeus]
MELLRTLHHRAVRATPSPKHGVAVLESQLAEADRESRLSKNHKDVLAEALLDRQHRIADLEVRLNQLEADWGAERARANALAETAPDIEGLLRERDEPREEVRRLQSEVRETELRRAQAEERCALLERQLRSLEETAEAEEEGGEGEVLPHAVPGPGRGARRMPRVLLVDDNLNNRFLTAMGPDDSARGYAADAVDYLAKPFDPWVLRAKVAVFTGIHLERNQRSNR